MPVYEEPTLDCQDCGTVLRFLSPEEAQRVADQPYNFIVYCRLCARERPESQV